VKRLGLLVVGALLAGACGGDESIDREERGGETLVQTEWMAGDQFGHAYVSWQVRDPVTLRQWDHPEVMVTDRACVFGGQLGMATADGALPFEAEDGACVVTSQRTLRGSEDTVQPACAGAFSLRLPGMTQRLMACDDESFPAEYAISCDLIVGQPELRVTSGPMESEAGEDVLVSLDGTVPITPAPTLSSPDPGVGGRAPWPEGDLSVEWVPRSGSASAEVILGSWNDPEGPAVHCFVRDDGEFTIPEALVAPYRDGTATLEIAQITMQETEVDGFDFRLGTRSSTGMQLIRP